MRMLLKVRLILIVAVMLVATIIFYMKSKGTTEIKRSFESKENGEAKLTKATKNQELPPFSFDDIWSSNFSYSTFYPNWISSSQYLYRDGEGIKKHDFDTNQTDILLSNTFYQSTGADGWSMSVDEEYLLVRTSYNKQWRHSYNGSYAIYSVESEELVLDFHRDDIQYVTWSPVGHSFVYVVENNLYYIDDVTDFSTREVLENNGEKNKIFNGIPDWVYEEEMVSSTNNIFWSPDGSKILYLVTDDTNVETIEFSFYGNTKYPEMMEVAYPKAGTQNPKVTLKMYDTEMNATHVIEAPVEVIGSDHLFCDAFWYPDSQSFLVYWLNRISTISVPQICNITTDGWTCFIAEVGIEESATGWIGNGGTPFRPIMLNDSTNSYFTAFSNQDGFWQIAFVDVQGNTKSFLTTGSSVVVSLQAYDRENDKLYFIAAHPLPRKRHLFRIPGKSGSYPVHADTWECLTCEQFVEERCQWISPSFSPLLKYLVVNCGGPDVPMSTLQTMDQEGNYGIPTVVENNDKLVNNKAGVKWPIKEYGSIASESDITILYQMHKPQDFVESKKYPLLIEVYGGPGFQKVQDRWTRSWAPIHLVSQYNIIVVSLDARGSGYRGDGIAHLLYKKLGQLEKVDTTEVGRYFAEKPWIDETKLAVWGWSYGGYTTTFTISEGSGVFKCGLAVAPLATRFLYDSIHTERYMTLPKDNPEGYEKCSILNTNMNNFKKASYSIIHGTADDNVHFQNAARISKALIAAGVDFDNFYYADEAHSINTGENANRHIYQLLTRKIGQCFNLDVS